MRKLSARDWDSSSSWSQVMGRPDPLRAIATHLPLLLGATVACLILMYWNLATVL